MPALWLVLAPGSEVTVTESDDELRKRLLYVAGDGDVMSARIASAWSARLDEFANALGLERRRTVTKPWPQMGTWV